MPELYGPPQGSGDAVFRGQRYGEDPGDWVAQLAAFPRIRHPPHALQQTCR